MKIGMMDVGIFCKEPRFGISTEKGKVPFKHAVIFYAIITAAAISQLKSPVMCALTVSCCVFIPDCSITKFLNRILGLEVHKQNYLFQYFTDNFDYLIEKDKKEGKYDMGILGMELKCYS